MLPSDLTVIVFSNLLWFLLTLCLGSVLVTRPSRPERAGQARRGLPPARLVPAWQSRVKAAETRQTFRCGAALASPRTGRPCRPSAHRHDRAAPGSRGAPGRPRNARSLASTGTAATETEPLTFLVSPADPNPPGAELAAGEEPAADELAVDEPAVDEEFGAGDAFRVSDYLALSDYPVAGEELAAGDEFAADDVVAVSGEAFARDCSAASRPCSRRARPASPPAGTSSSAPSPTPT